MTARLTRGAPKAAPTVLALALALALSGGAAAQDAPRIAIRAPADFLEAPESHRVLEWAQRAGIEIQVGEEGVAAPSGWHVLHLATLPCAIELRRRLARFPLKIPSKGFEFDGRVYAAPGDAIALTEPGGSADWIVIGNSRRAVIRLAARRLFRETEAADYQVVSGELSKEGRFLRAAATLSIDRASDRDEIAAQADFLGSLKAESRAGVVWKFREAERSGVEKWEPVLRRFLRPERASSLEVRVFPDAVTKARSTGSSRPADISADGGRVVADLDSSAPATPDCISPVLVAAAFAAEESGLLARPILLGAAGARAFGRWWGKDIRSFAAFTRRAGVSPSVAQVVARDADVSPILAVGAAAAWLEAGARAEGEPAVRRALSASDAECEKALSRWSSLAERVPYAAPVARRAPAGFLRGVSFAMTNTVSGSYASSRSRETLVSLTRMSVDSVAIIPYAYCPGVESPRIAFLNRQPGGETDEGTVRAVGDAHGLGMSAMVKPQIWVGGGEFVGKVAMHGDPKWREWFDAYRHFIVHQAVIAEASGADLFCVGTELMGTEERERDWRDVIAAVRLATSAPLTYAANWASGATAVPFWNALDLVGVDFYDPLSKDPTASDAALVGGVRRATEVLAALAARTGKLVVFTEAGFPQVQSAWMAPHDEASGRPPLPSDAARSVAAVVRALETAAWWKGVYWWKVFSDGRPARPGDRGYNILGTPAAQTIAEAFARLAQIRRESP